MSPELIELLKVFIERNSNVPDLQFDPNLKPKLPIDPYSKNYEERKRTAHYLLLVASIDEGNVVGVADNARKLIVRLYDHFGEGLFEITDEFIIREVFHRVSSDLPLSRLREKIPEILASVNRFVSEVAGGDLIGYSKRFRRPMDFVNIMAPSIVRMGKDKNYARKKAWMYMRWMARDYPDLRIFDHFSPRDLFVPLDKNVARVAVCLGVLSSLENLGWKEVVKVTEFARSLYPDDPARIDYPFFLLGREMNEKRLALTMQTLKELLKR
ncbi:DUF2400 domain-containing protein [Archaeoglobales archaeon]|nr:MAG: DUF2400 domain-containing protein [Archaeoglobales archaeon]